MLLGWSRKRKSAREPVNPTVHPCPVALPQDKASGWPLTRPWPASSAISALSRGCQGLRHMPPNPWRLPHSKQEPS